MSQLMDVSTHNANWIQHHFAQVSAQINSAEPDTDELVYNLAEIASTDGSDDFAYEIKCTLKSMTDKFGFIAAQVFARRAGLLRDSDRSLCQEVQNWLQEIAPK